MNIKNNNLTIRSSEMKDIPFLLKWWNDGEVMAHAGFPKGLGITETEIAEQVSNNSSIRERLIIEVDNIPAGEMGYSILDGSIAEIGIKICVDSQQGHGYGVSLLKMLIHYLFEEANVKKIILDTNIANLRAQHVYDKIGFVEAGIRRDSWEDQLGLPQTSIDYEMTKERFILASINKLETQYLFIRRFNEKDAADLYEYLSDEEVVKYEPYNIFNQADCVIEANRRSKDYNFWAVCLKDSGKMIGNLYFAKEGAEEFRTWEIGYVFNPRYSGHGYATQSVKKMMEFGFEKLHVRRIIACCNPLNSPSWKLLERLHMRKETHALETVYFKFDENKKPIWHDTYQYAILDREWAEL